MSVIDTSFMAAEESRGPWSWFCHQLQSLQIVFATMFRADPIRTVALLVLRPANAAGAMISALWLKYIIQHLTDGGGSIALGAAGLGVTFALVLLCSWLGVIIEARLQERTSHEFDQRIARTVWAESSLVLLDTGPYRDRLELLKDDSASLPSTVTSVVDMISATAAAAIGVGVLLSIDPLLLGLVVAAVPSLLAGKKAESVRQHVLLETAEETRAGSDIFNLATSVQAAKEVRTLGLQEELMARYEQLSAEVVLARRRGWNLWAAWQSLSWMIFVAGFACALAYVVTEAHAGRLPIGDVVLVVIVGAQINFTVAALAYSVTFALGCIHAVDRLSWIEKASEKNRRLMHPRITARRTPSGAPGLELREVSFSYADGTPALGDITLSMPAGTVTAVVGENGSGKTTLVKLLARFYEVDEGEIFLDGISHHDIDPEVWRANVAGVLQDFACFELLAQEAVGVGDLPRIDDNRAVTDAMERAGAADLLDQFPNGRETALGVSHSRGYDPSRGQWQKLALGRGMMRPAPRLVLLDEPMSALDPIAEERLLASYSKVCKEQVRATGAVAVITSHRLSVVGFADQIVVLDNGRVIEVGSHAGLLTAGGRYAELFQLQSRAFHERPTLKSESAVRGS